MKQQHEVILFFIPARGGSKGIPGKNLKEIEGVPLLGRAISTCSAAAEKLQTSSRIVVSTDDEAIATVASSFGAQVHCRPTALSRDTSTTEEALVHYLGEEKQAKDHIPGYPPSSKVAMLQCTSPFTRPEELLNGINLLGEGFDSAFIGVENHYWLYQEIDNHCLEPFGHHLDFRPSRQDVSPRFHETGAAYFFHVASFMKTKFRLGGRIGCVRTDFFGSIDIDEEEDLQIARRIWPLFSRPESPERLA